MDVKSLIPGRDRRETIEVPTVTSNYEDEVTAMTLLSFSPYSERIEGRTSFFYLLTLVRNGLFFFIVPFDKRSIELL